MFLNVLWTLLFMKTLEADVIIEGNNLECTHDYIFYVNDGFPYGQSWWCDMPGCGHHEGSAHYEPSKKIEFPALSFIRTSNPQFGAEEVYAHRADERGIVTSQLPENQRVRRRDLLFLL